jgi:hypothetical protein
MSIAPSGGAAATIAAGESVMLSGRIYPRVAGGEVTLNYLRDGVRRSLQVPASAGSEPLPGGATATYSSYSFAASPLATTEYYFSSGAAVSPHATVTVVP